MRTSNWTDRQLASFSRQLGELLAVGFGLLQALQVIERHGPRRLKGDIRALLEQLQQGNPLSVSLANIRFPPFYRFLITAAEHHGKFDETLSILSDYYEQRAVRRNEHRKALVYPFFVFAACIASSLFIVYGLLPQLASLYDAFALDLPWYTAQLLRFSVWKEAYWTLLSLTFLFAALLLYMAKRHRIICEKLLLRLPIVSMFVKTRLTTIALKQIGRLLDSGARVTQICDLFSTKEQWAIVARSFQGVKRDLLDGASFSQACQRVPFLHPVAVEAVFVFEQSGTLATGLTRLAEQFESEYARRIAMLAAFVETSAIVCAGVFVFSMILVLFLPMFHFIQYV